MRRRDFVKAVMAASVSAKTMLGQQTVTPPPPQAAPPVAPSAPPPVATAPGPVPWMRGLREVKPLPITPLVPDAVAQTSAHFFTDRQLATLRQLSEIMLPPLKGYPGAIDAGAPEFLDFLIGVSPVDRQQMYQSGLDRLDAEARQRFGMPFAGIQASQADELLRPWLRTWMTDHPPAEPFAHFVNLVHSDIRTATINSEAWSKAETAMGREEPDVGLYWFPVDPDIHREEPGREASAPVRHPAPKKQHA
ncbi:gluconate 2-dehydrogenase subunit 3 family protein [Paracidobacterium acidisoli]|uniref:Gluconate 2-dehydrogenase subunit 3 family protein n=1 Tax=Paracidobacterium acidisoli TaxID=2303751 RepID=A0A372INJ2_9BACT|nr:gluconate 2-dehydrogenase subunit 3 family protein [Paracidobacterium acidisoli]MBT9332129.1 gluconate 2-dehydrogenase subunit 3 family protein [Paracidobacterium acidisoli]